ncbi:MAG TPA: hypothetical protein VE567_00620 [Sphingomonas sp.]|nr:hypothetical protein [Sphingomonas sp.]
MLILALVFFMLVAVAALCAVQLTRTAPARDVAPMKVALERRLREGGELRF